MGVSFFYLYIRMYKYMYLIITKFFSIQRKAASFFFQDRPGELCVCVCVVCVEGGAA